MQSMARADQIAVRYPRNRGPQAGWPALLEAEEILVLLTIYRS